MNSNVLFPKCVIWDWVGTLCQYNQPNLFASKCLELFHSNNVKQCIVSNGLESEILDFITSFGWINYIDLIAGGDEKGERGSKLEARHGVNLLLRELRTAGRKCDGSGSAGRRGPSRARHRSKAEANNFSQ